MSRVCVFNDTSYENHFGCLKVKETIKELAGSFDAVDFYSFPEYEGILTSLEEFVPSLILVNGEGTFHSDSPVGLLWMKICEVIKKKYSTRIFLVNASWFNNQGLNGYLNLFDRIYCRDYLSKKNVGDIIDQKYIELMPDFSVYSLKDERMKIDNGEIVCVGDSVQFVKSKWLLDYANANRFSLLSIYKSVGYFEQIKIILRQVKKRDTSIANIIRDFFLRLQFINASKCWNLYLNDILSSRLVVTGRFHQVMICLFFKVPFVALQSNSKKIESVLSEIGLEGRLVDKLDSLDVASFSRFTDEEINLIDAYIQNGFSSFERLKLEVEKCI